MTRHTRGLFGKLAMMTAFLAVLSAASRGCADPPDSEPQQTAGPINEELLRREQESHLALTQAWKRGDRETTRRHLVELLSVRSQMYPVETHPAGHAMLLNCLLDLCRVCQDLNRTDDIISYGQRAREMAQQLYPLTDYPNGHPQLAAAIMAESHGFATQGDFHNARSGFLRAANQMEDYRKQHPSISASSIEGDALKFHATVLELEENFPAAAEYYARARAVFQTTGVDGGGHAACLLLGARVLRRLGRHNEALDYSENALCLYRDMYRSDQFPDGHPLITRAMRDLGLVLIRMGRHAEARRTLKDALAMDQRCSQTLGRPTGQRPGVLNGLLLAALSEGRLVEAEAYAEQLEEVIAATYSSEEYPGGHPVWAGFLTNIGSGYHLSGDLETAADYYGRSLAMWKKIDKTGRHPGLITVLDALGRLYLDRGQYARAHAFQSSALALAREVYSVEQYPNGHEILSRCLQNMAALYWFMGETEKSAAAYAEAVNANERLFPAAQYPHGHPILQQSYAAWGCVLMNEGRLDEAEHFLLKSHEAARRLYDSPDYPRGHELLNHTLFDLGTLEFARGRYTRAQRHFEEVLDNVRRLFDGQLPDAHHTVADTLGHLGRVSLVKGEIADAIDHHERALAIRRVLLPAERFPSGHPRLFRSLLELGNSCLGAGDCERASRCFSEAAEMECKLVASFCTSCSEAELLNYAGRKLQAVDYLLSNVHEGGATAAEVYRHVWRRHALVQRLIAQRQSLLRGSAAVQDPDAYRDYVAARRALSRALLVSMSDDVEESQDGLRQLRRLNARKEELERQLAAMVSPVDAVTVSGEDHTELADLLPNHAVFVDFLQYERHAAGGDPGKASSSSQYAAFIVAPGRAVQFVELGRAQLIDELVDRWLGNISESRDDGVGRQLSELVWRPVEGHLPKATDTIYFCPDGTLAALPWAALPDRAGGPLVLKFATAVVPSGPFLLAQLRPKDPAAPPSGSVLAVGDVNYGAVAAGNQRELTGIQRIAWDSLPGTARELQTVAEQSAGRPVVIVDAKRATVERVLDELPRARWAHIATHGFFVGPGLGASLRLSARKTHLPQLRLNSTRETVLSRNPFVRSGLVLAGANVPVDVNRPDLLSENAGLLTAESIATADCSRLELAVLSACESARGDQQVGDGVFGLQCAFHVAGARNVVAGMWKVDDQAASRLMADFYRYLWAEKMSPLNALRHAQLDAMEFDTTQSTARRGPRLASTVTNLSPSARVRGQHSVYQWAGFRLSGCGR